MLQQHIKVSAHVTDKSAHALTDFKLQFEIAYKLFSSTFILRAAATTKEFQKKKKEFKNHEQQFC